MKIAFLSYYSGLYDRGVEVAVAALARGLSRHHDVTVFQSGTRTIKGVKTVQLPVKNTWPPDPSQHWTRKIYVDYYSRIIALFTFRFLPFFIREKYDVIIPTNGGWQTVIARIMSWLMRKKLIVQGNAGIGWDDRWQLLWRPDQFIAISPQGFKWANKRALGVPVKYIPYGVDTSTLAEVKPISIDLKPPIVLCVSAFQWYKRVDLLIKAMKYVPQASLLVIGQGIEGKKLRRLGGKLLGERFLLLTGVNHDKLLGYYKAADLFSLPSEAAEALGIVNIEAMAAGLAIVAPDDYNRREIMGEAGVFVDVEDSKAYAKAIQLALTKDFGEKPIRQAVKYDWINIIGQYEKLIEQLFKEYVGV